MLAPGWSCIWLHHHCPDDLGDHWTRGDFPLSIMMTCSERVVGPGSCVYILAGEQSVSTVKPLGILYEPMPMITNTLRDHVWTARTARAGAFRCAQTVFRTEVVVAEARETPISKTTLSKQSIDSVGSEFRPSTSMASTREYSLLNLRVCITSKATQPDRCQVVCHDTVRMKEKSHIYNR